MQWAELTLVVLVVLGVIGWLLWQTAKRIDALHRKVITSRATLETQLIKRAVAAVELSSAGLLDPASAMTLNESSFAAVDSAGKSDQVQSFAMLGLGAERERKESELSATLRHIFPDLEAVNNVRTADPIGDELIGTLAAAWYRAMLARRFHNQAATDARESRKHWWVRVFRLAGHAPLPETLELDDAMTPELSALAA
jgi:hypothetical protein